MKKIKFENQIKKVSKSEIMFFEKSNDFTFPKEYILFLQDNNGGVPEERMFHDKVDDSEFYIRKFYSLKYTNYPLEKVIKNLHGEGSLPKDFFPFASNGGAGVYAFKMEAEFPVYVFTFDGFDPLELSYSFEDFIDDLEEPSSDFL
jgi:hypothetical protein